MRLHACTQAALYPVRACMPHRVLSIGIEVDINIDVNVDADVDFDVDADIDLDLDIMGCMNNKCLLSTLLTPHQHGRPCKACC